ncbi:MAG: site-2 protease family protein [Kiritimatiellia bacterium]
MFGKGIRLFKLFGFEVRIDATWLLLAVLIIVSLTGGYFPFHYEDLKTRQYVIMGVLGALGLFASIIIHEMSHSLAGRRFGIPMKGITLFMFGGVAQMSEEPRTPRGEFYMAAAGPLASFALAGMLYGVYAVTKSVLPVPATGVIRYLAWINVIVAFFNLLPAFPLDGGRILRSMLWAWKKNLRWATGISSDIGSGFGLVLIILGIVNLLGGGFVGGLWWVLIGMFLRGISHGSYRQVVIRETLSGEPVSRFMREDPVSVTSDLSVEELVNDYVYRYHFKMFPVVDDGRIAGCVSTRDVKNVDRGQWRDKRVGDIARKCSEENTISPDTDAAEALSRMNQTGNSRLMVVDDGRLKGIISLKDMLKFLAVKLDLEGAEGETRKLEQEIEAGG